MNLHVSLFFRDVVSNISLGPVLLDIRAHNCWRDLFRYFATTQIRQVCKF